MADNDALLTNQMPHSPQAEQAVLGSMLIDADCVKDVMDQLQTQDFYLRTNRDIFETIYQMFVYSKPIDGVTVAGEMERNGTYDENTTRNYLVQLMEVTPTSANVNEYADIVRDKALLRAIAAGAGGEKGVYPFRHSLRLSDCRSGRAIPWRIGPMARASPRRCTSL